MTTRTPRIATIALGLALAAPFAPPSASTADAATNDGDEPQIERALVKVKIARGDKKPLTSQHMVDAGVDAVFTHNDEGKRHEVSVLFEGKGDKLKVVFGYKKNGRKLITETRTGKPRSWMSFKAKGKVKAKVSVFIDPDAKRADGVGITETEDPIEGAPQK